MDFVRGVSLYMTEIKRRRIRSCSGTNSILTLLELTMPALWCPRPCEQAPICADTKCLKLHVQFIDIEAIYRSTSDQLTL